VPIGKRFTSGCKLPSRFAIIRIKRGKAYRYWLQQFQTFTKSKDAGFLGMDDVKGFLSHLAVNKQVAASSQNQAFNALLFLFKNVLQGPLGAKLQFDDMKMRHFCDFATA